VFRGTVVGNHWPKGIVCFFNTGNVESSVEFELLQNIFSFHAVLNYIIINMTHRCTVVFKFLGGSRWGCEIIQVVSYFCVLLHFYDQGFEVF
jgi:hypothetical protein